MFLLVSSRGPEEMALIMPASLYKLVVVSSRGPEDKADMGSSSSPDDMLVLVLVEMTPVPNAGCTVHITNGV